MTTDTGAWPPAFRPTASMRARLWLGSAPGRRLEAVIVAVALLVLAALAISFPLGTGHPRPPSCRPASPAVLQVTCPHHPHRGAP